MLKMEWIMVRLQRETHLLLMGCKMRYESEANAGRLVTNPNSDRHGMSIDSVVRELIRRDEQHKARSKKSAAKRREAARAKRVMKDATEACFAPRE